MKTYIDCIPCFFQQALDAARAAGASDSKKKLIVDKVSRELRKYSMKSTPPEMGRILYKIVKDVTGNRDPFKRQKVKSNELALGLYAELKHMVAHSPDRLLKAVELAIIGNSIDYGAQRSFDVEKEMRKILNREFDFDKKEFKALFNYRKLKNALNRAKRILYIGDNAGEIVFDRVFIEELLHIYGKKISEIVYVVRGGSIINDVLMEDAQVCGIDKSTKVISSGCDAPGVVLGLCTPEYLRYHKKADLIISKGQGNFESLPNRDKRIFFLFRVKCPVVAKDMGHPVGSIILKSGG